MALVWREQMSVGNTLIDNEHKYLLEQVNAVERALNTEQNHDILVETLDHLVDYTKNHFDHEEQIQRKINYPDIEEHKREHRKIMMDLYVIKKKLDITLGISQEDIYDEEDQEIVRDSEFTLAEEDSSPKSVSKSELQPLADLIRGWVLNHVISNDMKLKPYLLKRPADFS